MSILQNELYKKCLRNLQEQGLYRQLQKPPPGLDFTHNDYLNLSRHPEVIAKAQEYAATYGAGGRASRLIANGEFYAEFEEKIARTKGTEAALIFSSGYQTNATVLGALLNPKIFETEPEVYADRLNHASTHLGCGIAGVSQSRYANTDLQQLEKMLAAGIAKAGPKFIISESVFSMDGSVADVAGLHKLAQKYGALLYLDEAHATGVFGPDGYGMFTDTPTQNICLMGTFSKALGAAGGYVACSQVVKDYLVNKCGGFIYSTAPAPAAVGAASMAWDLLPQLKNERAYLSDLANKTRNALQALDFDTGLSASQIIPIIIGDTARALHLRDFLRQGGINTAAIRPPTVQTARLRLSLNTSHRWSDIEQLLQRLQKWRKSYG